MYQPLKKALDHANRHRVSTVAILIFIAYATVKGIHGLLSPEKLIDPIILIVLEHITHVGAE